MVCPSSEVCSWQWTPHWCRLSRATAHPGEELQTVTEWPLQKPNVQRRGRTPSWLVLVPGPVWWFWLWRWAAGGPKKPRPGRNRGSHSAKLSKRGGCGGARSFLVRRPNHLLRPCWVGGGGHGSGLAPPSHEVERDQAVARGE